MSRPFLIDANAFKKIYDDLVEGSLGEGSRCLDSIMQDDHILIDDRGKIQKEWCDCSCGAKDEYFREWISQRMIEDKIRAAPARRNGALRSALNKFGMPNDDRVYCYLAESNNAYGIVSNDIDLYNPKAKLWDIEKRTKLMLNGKACVVVYMRRTHKVEIFPLEQIDEHCS
jgi:hypothetical protein